jgi:mannose-6-phosphate isomerase
LEKLETQTLEALRLVPEYHERVWGGQNLRPTGEGSTPIGEAWIVYEGNKIDSGPLAGRTLGEVSKEYGEALLGRRPVSKTGSRFPLLIKLLDCADWLSVQVHPDDKQARELEGPDHFGKTEAWHILKAERDAKLISGLKEGTTHEAMADAIRNGTIADLANYQPVQSGDTVFTPARTIHALGPGLFLYEIQQTSDITYRVFDWDRPQSAGRKLHIEESIKVSDPGARCKVTPASPSNEDGKRRLLSCPYFTLYLVQSRTTPVFLDTRGDSFALLTVIEGELEIEGAGWSHTLGKYDTVIVPACCGTYQFYPHGEFRALLADVE